MVINRAKTDATGTLSAVQRRYKILVYILLYYYYYYYTCSLLYGVYFVEFCRPLSRGGKRFVKTIIFCCASESWYYYIRALPGSLVRTRSADEWQRNRILLWSSFISTHNNVTALIMKTPGLCIYIPRYMYTILYI